MGGKFGAVRGLVGGVRARGRNVDRVLGLDLGAMLCVRIVAGQDL